MARRRLGILFDIDGVLLRGGTALPTATNALQRLHQHNIPHGFVSNGGGKPESAKATELQRALDAPWIDASQIVLSHTPMASLVPEYGDSRVLVVGGVAGETGYTDAARECCRTFAAPTS